MASLFFSYSHKDEALRDRLEVALAMLKKQGLLETWHDRRILGGDDLDQSISAELENADIILLLISPDFLNSSYCYDKEMQRAMQRHESGTARVIPIILRFSDWQDATPFRKLRGAPRDGKPVVSWTDLDEAFLDITETIKTVLKEISSKRLSPASSPPIPAANAAHPAPSTAAPVTRSSNLAIKKSFSQADQDRFLEESFSFIARYFENSLEELKRRNPGIETNFRPIDANTFTATIYNSGKEVSSCRIALGSFMGRAITYSYGARIADKGFSESISVVAGDHSLFLQPLGMPNMGNRSAPHFTAEGGAEYYWAMLFEPLKR